MESGDIQISGRDPVNEGDKMLLVDKIVAVAKPDAPAKLV